MVLTSHFVHVDGARTHYLEAGDKAAPVVVLLHSGEFGASAELSWEFNFEALSRDFRVVAPDWLGFGGTDKLFDFTDMWRRRVAHITGFLAVLGIAKAHFIGNSMGASTLVTVAAGADCPWPIDRMVIASGGGMQPQNEAREVLNTYDGSREHMRRLIRAMLVRPDLRDDPEYLERRFRSSLVPGAWECTAAARFRVPGRPASGAPRPSSYRTVPFETLLVVGAQDSLREPGYANSMAAQIPRCRLLTLEHAGHCPQIDDPDAFNAAVVAFFKNGITAQSV